MKTSVTIKGLDDVVRKLDKIDTVQADKGFQEGLVNGCVEIIDEAKRRVPVKSGMLKDSLHIGGYTKRTPEYKKNGRYGALPKPVGSGKGFGVYIGSTLPYAHLVERGTRRTSAKPFLRPAVDTKERVLVKKTEEGVQKAIDGA